MALGCASSLCLCPEPDPSNVTNHSFRRLLTIVALVGSCGAIVAALVVVPWKRHRPERAKAMRLTHDALHDVYEVVTNFAATHGGAYPESLQESVLGGSGNRRIDDACKKLEIAGGHFNAALTNPAAVASPRQLSRRMDPTPSKRCSSNERSDG